MSEDRFVAYAGAITAPATRILTITPHDTNELPRIGRALIVASGGTVVLRGMDDDHDETFVDLPAYAMLAIRARFIRATGTSATDIKVLD
jgi:hypothetical protein